MQTRGYILALSLNGRLLPLVRKDGDLQENLNNYDIHLINQPKNFNWNFIPYIVYVDFPIL